MEEIIERIRAKPSVESYVICDAKEGGPIYRRAQRTPEERAVTMAEALRPIAAKARGVVRDLDPAVRLCASRLCHYLLTRVDQVPVCLKRSSLIHFMAQNELQFVRIKTKKRELMMGVGAFVCAP